MKKLIICGCSYSAGDFSNENKTQKSWWQRVADSLNMEPICFARGASSNYLIRLQIDKILDSFTSDEVGLVIVSPTHPGRLTYNIKGMPFDGTMEQVFLNISGFSENDYPVEFLRFREPIIDSHPFDLFIHNAPPRDLVDRYSAPVPVTVFYESMKEYIENCYDETIEKFSDYWMIEGGLLNLHYNGYDFLVNTQFSLVNEFKDRFAYKDRIFHNQQFVDEFKNVGDSLSRQDHFKNEHQINVFSKLIVQFYNENILCL